MNDLLGRPDGRTDSTSRGNFHDPRPSPDGQEERRRLQRMLNGSGRRDAGLTASGGVPVLVRMTMRWSDRQRPGDRPSNQLCILYSGAVYHGQQSS